MDHQNLIHDSADEYGPIRVFDDGQFRILSFADGDEQSRIRLATPHVLQHEYTQAMMLSLLFCQPKRICILGLGGGSLLNAFYHSVPSIHITSVELRCEVIEAAKMFFKLPQGKRIELIEDDAKSFLEQGLSRKVDILMTDIYKTDGMDRSVIQEDFIMNCWKNLKEEGWLVLNCWTEHKDNSNLISLLKRSFYDIRTLDTGSGNWVVLAGKKKDTKTNKELKVIAQKISDKLGFSLTKHLSRLHNI